VFPQGGGGGGGGGGGYGGGYGGGGYGGGGYGYRPPPPYGVPPPGGYGYPGGYGGPPMGGYGGGFAQGPAAGAKRPRQEYDAATEAQLDRWLEAKRAKDFATSDSIRDQLRARGIDPDRARPR